MRVIDLMIIGAQKAGSTALNNYMNEHPEVLGHPQVEFAFFTDDNLFKNGFEVEFKRHFTKGNKKKAKAIVGKSVGICSSEQAIQRLYQHNPSCKLIFLLREPVSRAYSSYSMGVFDGWMKRDFSELKEIIKRKAFEDPMYYHFVRLGLYSEQLRIVYKYFPKEQVNIILYEDLRSNPGPICKKIYESIGVDSTFTPDFNIKYNPSFTAKSPFVSILLLKLRKSQNPFKEIVKNILPYSTFTKIGNFLVDKNKSIEPIPELPLDMKGFLAEYFSPFNEELEKMTGLDLLIWNE